MVHVYVFVKLLVIANTVKALLGGGDAFKRYVVPSAGQERTYLRFVGIVYFPPRFPKDFIAVSGCTLVTRNIYLGPSSATGNAHIARARSHPCDVVLFVDRVSKISEISGDIRRDPSQELCPCLLPHVEKRAAQPRFSARRAPPGNGRVSLGVQTCTISRYTSKRPSHHFHGFSAEVTEKFDR